MLTDSIPAEPPAEPAARPRAVLLVNVGTPDAADVAAVRRYLEEFLSDPYVIQLPRTLRWLQRPLARLIAWRRAPAAARRYGRIWTGRGSPLRSIMEDQAAALAALLPKGYRVFTAMRYGRPSIAQAVAAVAAAGIDELVVVPLYPQFSQTTTGTVVQELYRVLQSSGAHINVAARTSWYDDAGYTNAQARRIADFAAEHQLRPDRTILLYSAHGLPVSYIERGDPYAGQVQRSMALLTQRLGWPVERTTLAFQSRFGPAQWLRPSTVDVLDGLAARGERQVLLCPMSFAVDCLETLEEIDLHYKPRFEARGGRLYRCPALNTYAHFINALKNLVLRGPRPIAQWNGNHMPLIPARRDVRPQPAVDRQLDRFFMVGVSLASRIGPGAGPRLVFAAPQTLQCVRKPHDEVQAFLQKLPAAGRVPEALVWNTCHRFECYGWTDGRECPIADIRRDLLGDDGARPVNVLFGADAWHHLMRTIIGLNSGLPGDKDIVDQFASALQMAERCGTAGPRLTTLVDDALTLARETHAQTAWGRATVGYCYATIDRLARQLNRRLANLRHVVIGGSATSRSVLRALFDHFAVRENDTTLVYRAHQGGQAKQLRSAIGNGRRMRTDSYATPQVLNAIADADVVYYGIDAHEPVLTGEQLRELRDFTARPLVILDFNTAGSTRGVEQLSGVTLWNAARLDSEVETFAAELVGREQFPELVAEAEAWVTARAPQNGPGASGPAGRACVRDEQTGVVRCDTCGRDLRELVQRRTGDVRPA